MSDTTNDAESEQPLDGEFLPLAGGFEGYDPNDSGNSRGRPRLYDDPAEFDERVNEYFRYCRENPEEPMTITGLCLFLGFAAVQTLYNYERYPDFLESVQRARTMIAYGYEKRLHGPNNAGAKFALACIDRGMFWNDRAARDEDDPGLPQRHEDRLAHLR